MTPQARFLRKNPGSFRQLSRWMSRRHSEAAAASAAIPSPNPSGTGRIILIIMEIEPAGAKRRILSFHLMQGYLYNPHRKVDM